METAASLSLHELSCVLETTTIQKLSQNSYTQLLFSLRRMMPILPAARSKVAPRAHCLSVSVSRAPSEASELRISRCSRIQPSLNWNAIIDETSGYVESNSSNNGCSCEEHSDRNNYKLIEFPESMSPRTFKQVTNTYQSLPSTSKTILQHLYLLPSIFKKIIIFFDINLLQKTQWHPRFLLFCPLMTMSNPQTERPAGT
jgi:hypothetical protein